MTSKPYSIFCPSGKFSDTTLAHIEWIKQKHRDVNQRYGDDKSLPYEFHLQSAAKNMQRFSYMVPPVLQTDMFLAAWGHDLIENADQTYNNVKKRLGETCAELIYAVSNEKGKTRAERANDKYYEDMKKIEGAVLVKICDRIANVSYSKFFSLKTDSYLMYKKEQREFLKHLGFDTFKDHPYRLAFDELNVLFDDTRTAF